MEISDYLRAARGRRWLLVILPVVAALVAGAIAYSGKSHWKATAAVTLPLSSSAQSASSADQVVADYQSVLTTSALLDKVSAAMHIPAGTIGGGLTSIQIKPGGRIVKVTYTASHKANAAPVAREAARQGLLVLLQPQVDAANENVAAAQKANDAAVSALTAYRAQTGVQLPDDEYRAANSTLTGLQVALAQAENATPADPARVAGLKLQVAAAQKNVQNLAQISLHYNALTTVQEHTQASLNAAIQAQSDATSQSEQTFSAAAFSISPVTKASKTSTVGRAMGAAAVGGFVLALLLLILMELIWPVRQKATRSASSRSASASSAAGPATGAAPAPVD